MSPEDYFPQEERQGESRLLRYGLWSLIAAMVIAWGIMLSIQFRGKKKDLEADSFYHVEKQDVVPDL